MSFIDITQKCINNNSLNISGSLNFKVKFKEEFQSNPETSVQMEHSYSRDFRPIEGLNGLTTRTLLVRQPLQCPTCFIHTNDEGTDSDEASSFPIPPYNESAAKDAMNECTKILGNITNTNPDDQSWDENVSKIGWTLEQEKLFSNVVEILDLDNLARLAIIGRQHEPVHRRVIIDKSVHRFRQAFASVLWNPRLTQWLHGLLMESLPPTYMSIYLDILQTLKSKVPSLMDKVLFGKPMNINQELLAPVMKKKWDLIVPQKQRKLPSNAVILIVPSTTTGGLSSRMQKWCQLFTTIAPIMQVPIPNANTLNKQPLDQVCEQLVNQSRLKIQDLRREQPNTHIVLVGFNAGASLALQVSLTENVNSVVCMGFAYNTINGVRGAPDDQILDITTPIMFVIGQNSARTSQEEMESLREKMQSPSSLVVIGSADDVLRVPKRKRMYEQVTQTMVDNMVMDEIYEFLKNCITNPPGPRKVSSQTAIQVALTQARKLVGTAMTPSVNIYPRKRKISQDDNELHSKMKYTKNVTLIGRPRTRILPPPATAQSKSKLLTQPPSEVLNMAIQSILPETDKSPSSTSKAENDDEAILSALEALTQSPKKEVKSPPTTPLTQIISSVQQQPTRKIVTSTPTTTHKIKMIPSNQFIQIKPPKQNTQKIYTIKTSPMASGSNQGLSTQNQVFTVKTGSSPLSTKTSSNTIILNNSPKFTVYKSGGNVIGTSDVKTATDLSSTNILDLPILFADNEGNIQDTPIKTASTSMTVASISSTPSTSSRLILSQQSSQSLNQPQRNNTFILNPSLSIGQKGKPNKVVYINKNAIKPCTGLITKNLPPLKYKEVVVSRPKTLEATFVPKATGSVETDKPNFNTFTIQKSKPMDNKTATIIKKVSTGTVNAGTKQYQPIIINVGSDKSAIKNLVKVNTKSDSSQIKPTILLDPSKIKPLTMQGLLNKNLTVRKVVNFVQTKPGTTISQIVSSSSASSSVPSVVEASVTTPSITNSTTSASQLTKPTSTTSNQSQVQIQLSENTKDQ